jgi:hypothetical protein
LLKIVSVSVIKINKTMNKVEVTCSVKTNGIVRVEKFETQVDNATLSKASGMSSRKELNPWAKNFFPASEWVEVNSMRKI